MLNVYLYMYSKECHRFIKSFIVYFNTTFYFVVAMLELKKKWYTFFILDLPLWLNQGSLVKFAISQSDLFYCRQKIQSGTGLHMDPCGTPWINVFNCDWQSFILVLRHFIVQFTSVEECSVCALAAYVDRWSCSFSLILNGAFCRAFIVQRELVTKVYTFTLCVEYFTSPGIDTSQVGLSAFSVERSGSGVEPRTLDNENPGSNPVLRC